MKVTSLFQKENQNVMESINQYRKGLMDDMNLTLRLTQNNHTHNTKPVEWVDNLLIFEAPMNGLDYVIYPKNTRIQLVFVSKIALFITHIVITKSYRNNNCLYYVGEIIDPIVKRQQRESFRLDLTMDVLYQLLPNADELENTDISEIPFKNATCINISMGGICINCNEQLHSHDLVSLSFTLVETPMTIMGEVLFIGERTETGTYTHRIKFVDMPITDANLLNRLIFEKQRLQLKHL